MYAASAPPFRACSGSWKNSDAYHAAERSKAPGRCGRAAAWSGGMKLLRGSPIEEAQRAGPDARAAERGSRAVDRESGAKRGEAVSEALVDESLGRPQPGERLAARVDVVELAPHQPAQDPAADGWGGRRPSSRRPSAAAAGHGDRELKAPAVATTRSPSYAASARSAPPPARRAPPSSSFMVHANGSRTAVMKSWKVPSYGRISRLMAAIIAARRRYRCPRPPRRPRTRTRRCSRSATRTSPVTAPPS